MQTFSDSEFLESPQQVLDIAIENYEEVIITRSGCESAVILSLAEYESLKETAYLLRSPANVYRLLSSIYELESG